MDWAAAPARVADRKARLPASRSVAVPNGRQIPDRRSETDPTGNDATHRRTPPEPPRERFLPHDPEKTATRAAKQQPQQRRPTTTARRKPPLPVGHDARTNGGGDGHQRVISWLGRSLRLKFAFDCRRIGKASAGHRFVVTAGRNITPWIRIRINRSHHRGDEMSWYWFALTPNARHYPPAVGNWQAW